MGMGLSLCLAFSRETSTTHLPSSCYTTRMQFWARDVIIRRNMTTSIWVSISTILAAREAQVIDDSDQLSGKPVLRGYSLTF